LTVASLAKDTLSIICQVDCVSRVAGQAILVQKTVSAVDGAGSIIGAGIVGS